MERKSCSKTPRSESCCVKNDETAETSRHMSHPEALEEVASLKMGVSLNAYEGDQSEAAKRDIIREICPLIKHHNRQRPPQIHNTLNPAVAMSTLALEAVRLMKAPGQRPLRQVNIVGQLNHSASRGFLLLVNTMLLLSVLVILVSSNLIHGSVWPFNRSSTSHTSSPRQQHQQTPAPITQQFHYFWNHDQLEPKTFAEEASKILSEAQVQTNLVALGEEPKKTGAALSSNQLPQQPISSRQDSMQVSASSPSFASTVASAIPPEMVLPPAIQRQLTAMVLQMQREQQTSLMMQPKFDSGMMRRFMSPTLPMQVPINPMSRFWTAASSQHPAILPPPSHLFTGAESQVHGHHLAANPFNTMATVGNANIGGVPVFGPFMMAPTVPHPMRLPMPTQVSANTKSHAPAASKSSARRKSWPLIGSLVDRGSIFASPSQPHPVIAPPPAPSIQSARASYASSLPVDPVAIMDFANQLTNMIVNQIQTKAAQQKLLSLSTNPYEPQVLQDLQASASMLSPLVEQAMNLQLNPRPAKMQPPYLIQNNPLLSAQLELMNSAGAYNLSSADSPQFGIRIKRRHLSTQQIRNTIEPLVKMSQNPPYTLFANDKNNYWSEQHPSQDELTMKQNQLSNSQLKDVNERLGTSADQAEPSIVSRKVVQVPVEGKRGANSKKPSKKMNPSSTDGKKRIKESSQAEKNLRHLFMAVVTESPGVEVETNENNSLGTSLRRLKRSIDVIPSGFRTSKALGSDWKSIGGAPAAVIAGLPTFNPVDSKPDDSIAVQRRLAELTNSQNQVQAQETEEWPTQSKLKVKKLVSNASVVHYSPPNKHQDSRENEKHGKARTEVSPTKKADKDDIERFSMTQGESNRVVNYFQNLDIEKSTEAQAPSTQMNPTTASVTQVLSPPQTSPAPQINLAFSAPTRITNRQNESKPLDTPYAKQQVANQSERLDLKRQSVQHSSIRPSGNRLQQKFDDTSSDANGQTYSGSTQASPQPQAQQQQQLRNSIGPTSQQQQMVTASNADIQSAATGGNIAYANSVGSLGGQAARFQLAQNPNFVSLPGRLATLVSGQIGAGNLVRQGSSTSQGYAPDMKSDLLSLFSSILGADPTRRTSASLKSSVVVPMFASTSQDRQSMSVAPSNVKLASSQPNNSQNQQDRSQTSDQSQNFNEDLIPLPIPQQQHSPTSSQQSLAQDSIIDRNQNMFGRSSLLSEQTTQGDNSQSTYGSDSLDQNQMNEMSSIQDQNTGNTASFNDNSYGKNQLESTPIDQNLRFDQKLNQDSFMMPPFNQTENSVSENPDTSFEAQVANFRQSISQLQPQQSNDLQLLAAQTNLPSAPQQGSLGLDLQQLRATFSNIDQHQRFNQQLREAAAMNMNNYNSIQQHPSYSPISSIRTQNYRQPNSFLNYQPQSQLDAYNSVDEDAAAGTLAAAGIPTYPSAAQLLAIQNYRHQLDVDNLKSQSSEKREAHAREDKKGKKKDAKQVSHHYHFNNLGSPFEDQDSSFAPFNPLEIAAQQAEGFNKGGLQKSKANKNNKPKEEEEDEEEVKVEKSKKKGFLRRFSLKKLFKRFRKEKVKETGSDENKSGNAEANDR